MFLNAPLSLRQRLPFVTALFLFACAEPLSPDECGALLDRYVVLLAASDRPDTTEAEVLKMKTRARELAARDPSFQDCSERVSRTQFQCALAAGTPDRFEQCLL